MEVTLLQMLDARERRAAAQQELIRAHGLPLICFTMNIAGPVKDTPLIRRGFEEGCRLLEETLRQNRIDMPEQHKVREATGCEAFYVVRENAQAVKAICARIEDSCPLGRLFDMDVLDEKGGQIRREEVAGGARSCIVCGAPGRGCASRRTHTVEQLQQATNRILTEHFQEADRRRIGSLALQALLDEVCVTPKPGLVDRANSGSHQDMDIFTFTASAAALAPYLARCVALGQQTRALPPEETFTTLRQAGVQAEEEMFRATGGVNTHKGAIFTMGTVCGAVGRLWSPEEPCRDPAAILDACAQMTRKAAEEDFNAIRALGQEKTVGQRLYLRHGLAGIRGEVAAGLPSVRQVGLPALDRALAAGRSRNDAAAITLLYLIAQVVDTNMIARGGLEEARRAMERVRGLLEKEPLPDRETICRLDEEFIRKNLSPGGCADLLAVTLFLHSWCGGKQG